MLLNLMSLVSFNTFKVDSRNSKILQKTLISTMALQSWLSNPKQKWNLTKRFFLKTSYQSF